MKVQVIFIVLAAALAAAQKDGSANAVPAQSTDAVCDEANTLMGINQCFGNAYQSANKELNQLYSQLMKKHIDELQYVYATGR
jgi:uncharacterized protein YecT (DUF1311 family)